MTSTTTEKVTKPTLRRWPRSASSIVAKIRTKAHHFIQIVHRQVNSLLSAVPSLSRHSHLQPGSLEKRIASVLPTQWLRAERRQSRVERVKHRGLELLEIESQALEYVSRDVLRIQLNCLLVLRTTFFILFFSFGICVFDILIGEGDMKRGLWVLKFFWVWVWFYCF